MTKGESKIMAPVAAEPGRDYSGTYYDARRRARMVVESAPAKSREAWMYTVRIYVGSHAPMMMGLVKPDTVATYIVGYGFKLEETPA